MKRSVCASGNSILHLREMAATIPTIRGKALQVTSMTTTRDSTKYHIYLLHESEALLEAPLLEKSRATIPYETA